MANEVNERRKRALVWLGRGAGLLGVAFVISKLIEFRDQIPLFQDSSLAGFVVPALAIVHGAVSVSLALAWRELLGHLGARLDRQQAIRVYGTTQIAKYVPGNIAHFAGRQMVGVAIGIPAWPLVKSAVLEIAVFAITGALVASFAIPLIAPISAWQGFALSGAVLGICGWIAAYRFGGDVARAMALHAAFLISSGLIFVAVVTFCTPVNLDSPLVLPVCGAVTVASVLGLLTPGAPAGLGVRETVLYVLLGSVIAQPDLLLAIVLSRVVAVAGDLIFYMGSLALPTANR